jgi:hypothetical protein
MGLILEDVVDLVDLWWTSKRGRSTTTKVFSGNGLTPQWLTWLTFSSKPRCIETTSSFIYAYIHPYVHTRPAPQVNRPPRRRKHLPHQFLTVVNLCSSKVHHPTIGAALAAASTNRRPTMQVILGPFQCPFAPWRPADGRVLEFFAYDTETTRIDHERPYLTPTYILGAACDGRRGVFISRENVTAFFRAHQGVPFICHNAAFDLKVTQARVMPEMDIYDAVDEQRVWDTLILKRTHCLGTEGHTARGGCSLADCAQAHLGITMEKGQQDEQGSAVRTGFDQFLGKPPSAIPEQYLTYLAHDALATWHLFWELHRLIKDLLKGADGVYGYVSPAWLAEVCRRFGPLTHHVQLRASILMDVLRTNGIGIDQARREAKARAVQDVLAACKERLRRRGYLAGERGCGKAIQSILTQFHREHSEVEVRRTPSGAWSTAEEDLAELAADDPFFADYVKYRQAEKLLSTYLRKMGPTRLYPKFGYLLETGRTCCGGGFNLQNLPTEKDLLKGDPDAATIRGCFTAGEGNVFIDADYSQIELLVLAYVWVHQFGRHSQLAELINSEQDVHRLIAALVLGKEAPDVTKDERSSAKPVSFGRPGGMGAARLQRIAKNGYGIELTLEEVEQRIQAYHTLCPELTEHLTDEVDNGLVIAQALHLTPRGYDRTVGRFGDSSAPERGIPTGWLGGMLLKVLREEAPITRQGRPYTPEEIDYFWGEAQRLPVRLSPELQANLQNRQTCRQLWEAVRNWAGRRPVFTVTGRLRANTTFCSSRNTLFQGPAADGAILGLWRVWRAGYKLVDFVHDQLVVESPADGRVGERTAHIESLMKEGMLEVTPGMRVKVETLVTRSLNKKEEDPRYTGALAKTGAADRRPLAMTA